MLSSTLANLAGLASQHRHATKMSESETEPAIIDFLSEAVGDYGRKEPFGAMIPVLYRRSGSPVDHMHTTICLKLTAS